jgi:ABC-type transport system involved in multi-copper enzyme maturation permease subunit
MRKVLAIAQSTIRESLRSKIVFATLFFALAVVMASALFSSVTIGDHVKLVKDFGLFSMTFFTVLFAVISGGAMLYKELERKTIFNILSKSVSRAEFIWGKFLGMFLTSSFLLILMGAMLVVFCILLEPKIDWNLLQVFPYIILQLLIVCACTIFFSTVSVTPVLSGTFAFLIFFLGRSATYIKIFIETQIQNSSLREVGNIIYWMIPHLDQLNIADQAIYGHQSSLEFFIFSSCYALCYTVILLIISVIIFERREFN